MQSAIKRTKHTYVARRNLLLQWIKTCENRITHGHFPLHFASYICNIRTWRKPNSKKTNRMKEKKSDGRCSGNFFTLPMLSGPERNKNMKCQTSYCFSCDLWKIGGNPFDCLNQSSWNQFNTAENIVLFYWVFWLLYSVP